LFRKFFSGTYSLTLVVIFPETMEVDGASWRRQSFALKWRRKNRRIVHEYTGWQWRHFIFAAMLEVQICYISVAS